MALMVLPDTKLKALAAGPGQINTVIERREPHPSEVPPVPLLHHDPHGASLGQVHRLFHPGDLIHEGDGPRLCGRGHISP